MNQNFVLKGNICYSEDKTNIRTLEGGYVVCEDGRSRGVFSYMPDFCRAYQLIDFRDQLIIPGLTDLHVHAPQYAFRGLSMNLELLSWLNVNTFPEEAKYMDILYARQAYEIFVQDLRKSATTRACVFATIHTEATILLMDLLEESGLITMVGKVNMDRNAPNYLCEKSSTDGIAKTKEWIKQMKGRYKRTTPILTPRFIPTCSDEMMQGIGDIQREEKLPMQSHLSENIGEIAWVKELSPQSAFYGDAYDRFGLFGGETKTVMAHCVSSVPEEVARIKERGVYIAHCPQSNSNLSSGVAPVRTYLDMDLNIGLGSDIAGGASLSIFEAMKDAIQVSKLRWRLQDQSLQPITFEEAFYMGTKGGGSFFGGVGSFEEGYEMDAVVLNDENLRHPQKLSVKERLERLIYLSDDRNVVGKYVAGRRIF